MLSIVQEEETIFEEEKERGLNRDLHFDSKHMIFDQRGLMQKLSKPVRNSSAKKFAGKAESQKSTFSLPKRKGSFKNLKQGKDENILKFSKEIQIKIKQRKARKMVPLEIKKSSIRTQQERALSPDPSVKFFHRRTQSTRSCKSPTPSANKSVMCLPQTHKNPNSRSKARISEFGKFQQASTSAIKSLIKEYETFPNILKQNETDLSASTKDASSPANSSKHRRRQRTKNLSFHLNSKNSVYLKPLRITKGSKAPLRKKGTCNESFFAKARREMKF